ncbi:MAG TPA: hypothetical protein PK020_00080 [Ilumatobacteraceae bacterium]|nr:hypothetical protein [Ilumatobacteraceae bacterium]HRB01744.1 hypothetical protein [Ilumatobacteraceae bacterium]
MAKNDAKLGRGRKAEQEVAAIPNAADLAAFARPVQDELRKLVERAGGRMGLRTKTIPVGDVKLLANGVEQWAKAHLTQRNGRLYFAGRPGIWHFFDSLYPLQDPNRWDRLREAVTNELRLRGWERVGGTQGSGWFLPR